MHIVVVVYHVTLVASVSWTFGNRLRSRQCRVFHLLKLRDNLLLRTTLLLPQPGHEK